MPSTPTELLYFFVMFAVLFPVIMFLRWVSKGHQTSTRRTFRQWWNDHTTRWQKIVLSIVYYAVLLNLAYGLTWLQADVFSDIDGWSHIHEKVDAYNFRELFVLVPGWIILVGATLGYAILMPEVYSLNFPTTTKKDREDHARYR